MNNCCECQWKMVVIECFIYFCVLEGNDLSLCDNVIMLVYCNYDITCYFVYIKIGKLNHKVFV